MRPPSRRPCRRRPARRRSRRWPGPLPRPPAPGHRPERLCRSRRSVSHASTRRPTLAAEGTSVDPLVAPLDARALPQALELALEALLRPADWAGGEASAVAQVVELEGIAPQVVALDLGRPDPGALVRLQIGDAVVLGVQRRRRAYRGELARTVVVGHEDPVFAQQRPLLGPVPLIRQKRQKRSS